MWSAIIQQISLLLDINIQTIQINKNTFEKKKSLTAVIAETYRYK